MTGRIAARQGAVRAGSVDAAEIVRTRADPLHDTQPCLRTDERLLVQRVPSGGQRPGARTTRLRDRVPNGRKDKSRA